MRILDVAGTCGLGADPAAWRAGLEAGGFKPEAAEPERPRRVERDLWRRMGRLERMAVVAAAGALGAREGSRIGLVWGSAVGSVPASRIFRRSLDALGPGGASPAAFQVSVHNAAAGFVALATGLTGPAESVFAGGASGLVALRCAHNMLASGAVDQVLVLAGDARSRDNLLAHRLAGMTEPGDAVCALLVDNGSGPGPHVELIEPILRPDLARRRPLLGEATPAWDPRLAPDDVLGLVPAIGLWCVGALARSGGGTVVDWCEDMALGARVG